MKGSLGEGSARMSQADRRVRPAQVDSVCVCVCVCVCVHVCACVCSRMFRPDVYMYIRVTLYHSRNVSLNGANPGTQERESMFLDYGYVEVGDEVGWYLNMNGPVAGS